MKNDKLKLEKKLIDTQIENMKLKKEKEKLIDDKRGMLSELYKANDKKDMYKSRIKKAVEILKRYTDYESNYYVPIFELIDILEGKGD